MQEGRAAAIEDAALFLGRDAEGADRDEQRFDPVERFGR
jgi:hypothetical protein